MRTPGAWPRRWSRGSAFDPSTDHQPAGRRTAYTVNWTLAFVAFALLIILHEFGHFAAAKSVGMQVTRFSLFFPPALFKKQVGETSYEIGAIPLGGFVKITGMNPEEEIEPEHLDRAYFRQPVWKRIVVIAAGPAMNFLIAFILIYILFAFVGVSSGVPTTNVDTVDRDGVAAGIIEPGDKIVSIDGQSGGAEALVGELAESSCRGEKRDGCAASKPVTVAIERGSETLTFEATPRYDADNDRMRLGVTFAPDPTKVTESPGAAIGSAASAIWRVTKLTLTLPARLFDPEKRKEISSAAGGYEATAKAIDTDTERTIQIIALISLSLAVINLFPFLPLDGGHIFWALAEKVRGKPIPVPVLERASIIGLALIGVLFFIGLSNDIERFSNGGFKP